MSCYFNLTEEQKTIARSFLNSFEDRPDSKDHQRYLKVMPKIKIKKIEISGLNRVYINDAGFEYTVTNKFNNQNLPLGTALVPTYDSGDNYRLVNGGMVIIAEIWNRWELIHSDRKTLHDFQKERMDEFLKSIDYTGDLLNKPV